MKKLKKDSEITEDEYNSNEKEIQKTLDNYIDKIDKETNNKEQELMQV